MIVKKNFLKSIPKEKRHIVLKKMYAFNEQLLKYKNYRDMPKGFWIMRIKGTDIYKFRINNGDRLIFRYHDSAVENRTSIEFLSYKTHDKQILGSKNKYMSTQIQECDFDINTENYESNEDSEQGDKEYFAKEIYEDISELNSIVLEDEYICLLIDDNDEDYLKYLSQEQYECLRLLQKPIFITGSAGSGKSVVGIRKMIMNTNHGKVSTYITFSGHLKSSMEMYYNTICSEHKDKVNFTTINQLCSSILGIEEVVPVDYHDFKDWAISTEVFKENLLNITLEEVWYEIVNKIKGTSNSEFIEKEEYLGQSDSSYNTKEKQQIYNIAKAYQLWLNKNSYIDENDLAFKALKVLQTERDRRYDFVVIDEMQDMSNIQMEVVLKLTSDNNFLFIWDEHQVTRYNEFQIGKVKSTFYNNEQGVIEKTLTKNYRNSIEIDSLSQKVLGIKNRFLSKDAPLDNARILPLREGKKPVVLQCEKDEIWELLQRVDKQGDIAVVVWDEQEKQLLKDQSIPISRVFTISEIKGLDYHTIVCYNIITRLHEYVKDIQDFSKVKCNIAIQNINSAYVAMTRARKILCIIEENASIALKGIEGFFEIATTVDYEYLEIDKIYTEAMWELEGKKLEAAKRYYQAAQAYNNAGLTEKAHDCESKIVKRAKEINNFVRATAIRIESTKDLKFKSIKRVLELISKSYGVAFDDYVQIWVFNEQESIQILEVHLTGNENRTIELSNICNSALETIKQGLVNRKKVTIHVCLIKDDKIQELSSLISGDKDTIKVDISSKDKISINLLKTRSQQQRSVAAALESLETSPMEEASVGDIKYERFYKDAEIQYRIGNYENAVIAYEKVLSIEGVPILIKSTVCSQLGKCKLFIKQYEEAAYYGELAIEYDVTNNDGYMCVGTANIKLGDFEKAIAYYRKAEYKGHWKNNIDKGIEMAQKGIKGTVKESNEKVTNTVSGSNNQVEETIVNLLNAANRELHTSLRDYLEYRIQNARDIKSSVEYFIYFKDLILNKIQEYFKADEFPIKTFQMDFSNIAQVAENNYKNADIRYYRDLGTVSYEYQLAYYEIYCNGYIKYAFNILFNGANEKSIGKLKDADIKMLMARLDEHIHNFSLEKLRISLGKIR